MSNGQVDFVTLHMFMDSVERASEDAIQALSDSGYSKDSRTVNALRFVSDAAFGWLTLVGSHPDVVAAIANGTYVPPETKEQKCNLRHVHTPFAELLTTG